MNIKLIKKEIEGNLNKNVEIHIYGMRNRKDVIKGTISNVYPNLFTVLVNNETKSFRYADIITGEIKVKYL